MSDPKKKPHTSVPQSGFTSTLARLASFAPRAKKAEEDDEDDKASDDEEDADDGKAKKKGKKARSEDRDDDEDGDDADDEKDKDDKKALAARGRERGRIAAILNSRAAQRSDVHRSMAVSLALKTEMTRCEAIAALSHVPTPEPAKPAGQAARERLNTAPNPDVGASDGGGDGKGSNLAAQIVAAGKKRRGETT